MKYNGPWTAPSAGVYGADGLLICSLGGRDAVKAYRKRGDRAGEMIVEYARVVATAPELLDALKAALAFTGWDDPCMDIDVPPAIASVRAAIAKAEGK